MTRTSAHAARRRTVAAVAVCVALVAAVGLGAAVMYGKDHKGRFTAVSRMLHGESPFGPRAVRSSQYDGVPSVGTFLTAQSSGWTGRSCNATVVPSPGHNLIATAAHCIASYDGLHGMKYVPMWHDGKAPYGEFPFLPGRVWTDPNYIKGRSGYIKERWDLDVAFIQVGPNAKGQQVQDAVGGADRISFDAPAVNDTTMIGYPARLKYPIHCRAKSTPAFALYQQIACGGWTGGTSGSPWFSDWSTRTNSGTLIGVLGGYQRGGFSNDLEYGTRFGAAAKKLYEQAAAGRPQRSAGGIGGPQEWRGAAGLASGDLLGHTHKKSDDLVARFRDGSVRAFRGNNGGGFRPGGVRLLGPNAAWRNVTAFTVGDFGGPGRGADVLAVEKDGRVLLYRGVRFAPGGLGRPVQLQGPARAWAGTRALAAGPYAGGRSRNALIAVGANGQVSLHRSVGLRPGALASGAVLMGANPTWAHVRALSEANMVRNGSSKVAGPADLVALFTDGQVNAYPDLTVRHNTLATPNLLASASRERSRLTGLAAGRWIDLKPGGNIPDDVVAAWRNGAVVMHQNMNLRGLVREFQLVAPARASF